MRSGIIALLAATLLSQHPLTAVAAIDPAEVHRAEGRKTGFFIQDGLFVGGSREVDAVTVSGMRRSFNGEFERIVLDLMAPSGGEPENAATVPYFQTEISKQDNRVIVTIFGNPRLGFDSGRVQREFRKSRLVRKLELLPRLDGDSWTFALELKNPTGLESFHLSHPARIILDLRSSK